MLYLSRDSSADERFKKNKTLERHYLYVNVASQSVFNKTVCLI
jgi:hypothetical protein